MSSSPSTTTAPTAGSDSSPAAKSFRDLGVDEHICRALDAAGITTPFPIQELTLPLALSGADLIGQARTGTGKTLAFGIPMLDRVRPGTAGLQVLVIVPTRELCLQVADDLTAAGNNLDVSVVACYGGKAIDVQIAALRAGADVVVGTPGRLLDLRNRGELDLSTVTGLVLDEADEMLDLGFLPDVEQLIGATAETRQTLLFSATMPSAVVSLARRYMRKPTFLRAEVEEVHIAPRTQQHFFACHRMDKPAVLARILQTPERGLCVVFTRTKRMADILAEELRERGVDAAPIHSDLRQDARERALQRFREGKTTVLVATEVAARGLDIDDVTHVVNYDCPDDEKMYLHRIGRTGRAGAAGVAITLALWNELARVEMIKRQLDIDVPTHEVFSTSPILEELFDLPSKEAKAPRDGGGKRRSSAPAKSSRPVADAAAEQAAEEGAPASRSRTRRRSRSRTGEGRPAVRTAQEPAAQEPAAQEPAAQEPAAPAAAGRGADAGPERQTPDGAARTRVRRRVRQDQRDAVVDTPPDEGSARGDRGGRARRAKAADEGQRPAGEDDHATRSKTARGEADGSGGASAGDAGDEPAGRGEAPGGERGRRTGGRGSRGPKSTPNAKSTKSGPSTKSTKGGKSRRTSRGAGRATTDERGGARTAAAVGNDTEQVRGKGKPRLDRPMIVTHLP